VLLIIVMMRSRGTALVSEDEVVDNNTGGKEETKRAAAMQVLGRPGLGAESANTFAVWRVSVSWYVRWLGGSVGEQG
jgi:hypothetical protein